MNAKSLLILSIGLNLALACAFLVKTKPSAASPSPASAPAGPKAANSGNEEKPKAAESTSAQPGKLFDWRAVESPDYRKYIANLRSLGCPEETIRDIIVADVNKLFESRRKEMQAASTNKFQFWKGGNPLAGMLDPDRMQKQQDLNREKRALLKELLGVEPDEKPDMMAVVNPFETMLDFLPSSKQREVMELYTEYQAKLVKNLGNGQMDAEDRKQLQNVQKEMDQELAKVMSPQEKENYDLRMSQTAMMMRMQAGDFEASEQEFRDIFKLRKQFDDEFSIYGAASTDKAERDKRAQAQKELDGQLKDVLGQERFDAYKRNQDFAYQGLAKVADREQLPQGTAAKVYDMKTVAEQQVAKLRADKSLSDTARNDALAAIQAETERSIGQTMGEKALNSYKSQPGATWLKNLGPRPPRNQ